MPRPFALLIAFLLTGSTGCDAIEDVFDSELEVAGTVEAVGPTSITLDATVYAVTDETEYEGYTGIDGVRVGDEVEIEYEEQDSGLVALEVEGPEEGESDDD